MENKYLRFLEGRGKRGSIAWMIIFLSVFAALALGFAIASPPLFVAFTSSLLLASSIVISIIALAYAVLRWKFKIQFPIVRLFKRRATAERPPQAGSLEADEPSSKYEAEERPPAAATYTRFKHMYKLDIEYFDVYAGIAEDPETGGLKYVVIEPEMNDRERELYKKILSLLEEELVVDSRAFKDRAGAREYIKREVLEVSRRHRLKIPKATLTKFLYYFERDLLGLGKIEPLMHDPMIEDISCDGVGVPIYIWHREFENLPTNIMFESSAELDAFISRLAYISGKHVSLAHPMLDATLPDGSRVQLTFGKEVTHRGGTFTIRKFRADPLTVTDLIMSNTMSAEMAAYFWYAIEKKFSMLVAGGTASGKTTTLNVLSMFILPESKIVTIEDTRELNLPHQNWIPSVTRSAFAADSVGEITLFDLLKAALRQRPDIIIVGEVRGEEAYTLLQAAATGHGGLSTIHADSIEAAINRLSTPPMNVPKPLIASALHIISLQLKLRVRDRTVRRIVHVAEIVKYDPETDSIILNDVFKWDPASDQHRFLGKSHLFKLIQERYGESEAEIRRAITMREHVLRWMVAKGIRKYKDVAKVIREFYADPEGFYARVMGELGVG